MYCKIIAFSVFHLYFAILYFCLQNLFSYCNTLFSFAIIFVCKTYFLLAMLNFLLQFFIFVYKNIIFSQYFDFRLQNFILFGKTLFFCIYVYICGIELITYKTFLLKVKRLKNVRNLNAFELLLHERGQIKEIVLLYQCSHK